MANPATSILIKVGVASLISSVKNPKKKEEVKSIVRDLVQAAIIAYADDPTFLDFDEDGIADLGD